MKSNLDNLQPDLMRLLNKLEITDDSTNYNGERMIKYLSKNGIDYEKFESNIDIINQAIQEGTPIDKAYEILANIIDNNYISEDFIKLYNDPDITDFDIDNLETYLEKYNISLDQLYKILKNPEYQGIEIPVILGLKNNFNKEQLNNLVVFCKTIGEDSIRWRYSEDDILIDGIIPAIKENIPVELIVKAFKTTDKIKNMNELIKKFKKEN